jgi:uncharacterized protein (DUF1501 family)
MDRTALKLGCNGEGEVGGTPQLRRANGTGRRGFVLGAGGVLSAWQSQQSALADLAFRPRAQDPRGDILVSVFLRGGADGLNMVAPVADPDYAKLRPTLHLVPESNRTEDAARRSLKLDDLFGLHPAMASLLPLFREGQMAVVHAVGSGDTTQSHFEAMALMERGLPDEKGRASAGWLARHLNTLPTDNRSPLRAVAMTAIMPDSLRGTTSATAMSNLSEFRLKLPKELGFREEEAMSLLRSLYAEGGDAAQLAGRETLDVLSALRRLDPERYRPANGAVYPDSSFGRGMKQVACLLRGEVGLEVATLDHQGPYLWDTHVTQESIFPAQVRDLADGLAAFVRDMGTEMRRVTVTVQTEFGRRAYQNTGLGTDHGHASAMLLFGAGVRGGRVYAEWPGLRRDQLHNGGDLKVTTDYREVLASLVRHRLRNPAFAEVFPEYRGPAEHPAVRT